MIVQVPNKDAVWRGSCYVQCDVRWSWDVDEMMHDDEVDAWSILVHEMWAAAVANPNTI